MKTTARKIVFPAFYFIYTVSQKKLFLGNDRCSNNAGFLTSVSIGLIILYIYKLATFLSSAMLWFYFIPNHKLQYGTDYKMRGRSVFLCE